MDQVGDPIMHVDKENEMGRNWRFYPLSRGLHSEVHIKLTSC
jgi:hypothetical protein